MASSLNAVLEPSRITEVDHKWNTTKKEWPNGRVTTKRQWSAPKSTWSIEYDGITLADYNALLAHFDSVSGSFGTFFFTDTHTGLLYTVRFADDSLKRQSVRPNVRGLYKLSFKVEEAR